MRLFFIALLSLFSSLSAQPSSVFWTNCTTAVVPTGSAQIAVYDYFSVFNRRGHGSTLPTDVGFTLGLFTWHDWSCEAGIDYLGGTDDPLFFNAKVGIPENKLFKGAPSFSLGIFNVGTRTRENRTNQDIVDVILGADLPGRIGGTLYVGGFSGSRAMGKVRQGYMVAYQRNFCKKTDCHKTEYYKWTFSADYASGKNTIGGGGLALWYYYTPNIYLETGPVWFNDARINGKWKWSVQIYINVPIFKPEKMTWRADNACSENNNGSSKNKNGCSRKDNGSAKSTTGSTKNNKESSKNNNGSAKSNIKSDNA